MLSSPRLRRRLLWAGGGLAAVGAVALAFVLWPRASAEPAASDSAGPALEIAERPEVPLSRAARAEVLTVAQRFLTSAVARKRVAGSWELAHPDLRQGLTRREWAAGEIPIVPYPVDTARWRLGYSQRGVVGLEVYVEAAPGARLEPMVFDMEVRAAGRRWLVSSWAPKPTPGGPAAAGGPPERAAGEPAAVARADDDALGAAWLAAPALGLLGVLALPLALGLRDRRRGRRGDRLHAEHEGRRTAG